ncbi:larval cuticle protein LCP-17 [Diachasma alloeum]|uniref:larval cuticle protein LCP-17 n=1 Tax=Diachasma alloeum TaxID=454923 RepID=UPI000738393D|nr:larval cuticle protein LCP-17 [Diachasma alloeum]XP_015124276.1 larval cuticle protein LCP-17 [Diachasma alloeum]
MKFLVILLAVLAVAFAQQETIAIIRQSQDVSPDGSYNYNYETANGIKASEEGHPGPVNEEGAPAVVAQGQFEYSAPDGTPIAVTYTANENGFQPQGAHLPVAPPVPEQIARALEYILANQR